MSDIVERIVEIVARSRIRSVRIVSPELTVYVRRRKTPHAASHAPMDSQADHAASAAAVPEPKPVEPPIIRSRGVGIFRHLDPPFSVGDEVQAGQTVGIIESMKIPSEVRSEVDGVIAEVLVEDGAPVEFDQPLFVLSTAHGMRKGESE